MNKISPAKSSISDSSTFTDTLVRDVRPELGTVLKRARTHHQLSLRQVEKRIGKSNVYLSQVERGLVKQPDPVVLLKLAELYGLNFQTLATWADLANEDSESDYPKSQEITTVLVRQILELETLERVKLLQHVEDVLRKRRT